MFIKNNKGAALLQVLLVTAILAGMATMLLRVSLSRTSAARTTRRIVGGQLIAESCQEKVNAVWSVKTPEAFARDLKSCCMSCSIAGGDTCPEANCVRDLECGNITGNDALVYKVKAKFTTSSPDSGHCKLDYEISNTSQL